MTEETHIRRIRPGEEAEVCRLVDRVFGQFVAPEFTPEGIEEFARFAHPAAMAERRAAGQIILVAESAGRIVGMLELRGFSHIALLFVETPGRGIGRALYTEALRVCRGSHDATGQIRAHASHYAVPIYRKLGFEPEGPERTEHGIRYVPMVVRFGTPDTGYGRIDGMDSRDLIRDNLERSRDRVLARIDDMREHALVPPTPRGGCHTLWVLGHLAYIETLVVHGFMLGETNPLAAWEPVFDGAEVSLEPGTYPPFEAVLARCREVRESTLALLATLSEADLDRPGRNTPRGFEDTFGTYRDCLQYVADHWYMHRGHLADARRAAGLARMWV